MPDPGEDADAPIIVPRPGQILRRSARTKIRKQGQTTEGAHRFNAKRRGAGSKRDTPPPVPDPRSSSDLSTSDHDHNDAELPPRQRLLSNESLDGTSRSGRPESYSAEAFIFDAYARDDVNEDSIRVISPPPPQPLPRHSLSPPPPQASREVPEPVPPIQVLPPAQPAPVLPPLQHPLPQRASSLNTPASVETPSRSPSPVTTIHSDLLSSARPESRPVPTSSESPSSPPTVPGPQGSDSRREKDKDKDKKGLFKWGGGEKKGKKDQREKEKDAGFFGSLFGSKKKPEESPPPGLVHGQSGRDAAVALLGASKSSKGYVSPASPQPQGVNNYSRYPIHVERAIYRLSHIKLANPRRALYEQVLISNLMFWYLGVINKTQQPQTPQQQTQQQQQQTPTELGETRVQAQAVTGDSGPQKEQEKERAELEHAESERGEAKFSMQGQGQAEAQQPLPQNRRGSLTKATPANAGPRRAEQPVRGPQYDMQHRAMEQEYGSAFAGGARSMNTPPGIGYAGPPGSMSGPVPATAVGTPSPPAALSAAATRRSRSPPPPAGTGVRYVPTLPSLPQPQAQASPTSVSVPLSTAKPTPSTMSAVPASTEAAPVRGPARSLSANATPPIGPRVQGRKAQSAHAVVPLGARRPRTAENPVREEEDVPLALWQQQQQSLLSPQPRRR